MSRKLKILLGLGFTLFSLYILHTIFTLNLRLSKTEHQKEQYKRDLQQKTIEYRTMEENLIKSKNQEKNLYLQTMITKNQKKKIDSKLSNDRSNEEENPKIPLKLNIVVQTISRKNTGYNYLEQSFSSFKRNFNKINLKFDYFAFSRKTNEKPNIKDDSFHFIETSDDLISKYKPPLINKSDQKSKLIYEQSRDFLKLLLTWKQKCKKDEIFLFMEDDFTMCPNAALNIAQIYFWSLKRKTKFHAVRIGFGFNGLLLPCNNIDEMVNHITKCCYHPKTYAYPHDTGLATYWYAHRKVGKVMWTFRYNLFEHIGKISTVMNEEHSLINPTCYDSNAHHFNYYGEKFDTQSCQHHMVSPCNQKSHQQELELVDRDSVQSKPFLSMPERKLLMQKMSVKIFEGKIDKVAFSCNDVCQKNNAKCEEQLYPFVNNCEEMRSRHQCHDPCFAEVYRGFHHKAPLFGKNYCIFLDQPSYKCDIKFDWKGYHKLCACKLNN
eukprot:gene15-4266_t